MLGKNVKLTPINKITKCILPKIMLYVKPVIIPIQKYQALNNANTAPIDKT